MDRKLRIVFMGTAEFAVPSLEALLKEGYTIPAVVTVPDKPAGRGQKPKASPVKNFATANGLSLLQPAKLREPEFIDALRSLNPDMIVVVAFRMLPRAVWEIPPLGTLNLHASLLPDYRGAAPINRAVMAGATQTGVTTFLIDEHIDTGAILMREQTEIGPEETAGELHDRLKIIGAGLLIKTVQGLAEGRLKPIPQEAIADGIDSEKLKTAPKLTKEDCRIDWEKDVLEIFNQIRGLSPYPAAFTFLISEGQPERQFKILKAGYEKSDPGVAPGTVHVQREQMAVAAKGGWILPQLVQLEGKKKMEAEAFLRGFRTHSNISCKS
ncbi:MAG: methionyl-tRNA formyltransferase [Bacteroidales bacterium]